MSIKVYERKEIRKKIYDKFNGKCAYCGTELQGLRGLFVTDHIIAKKRLHEFNISYKDVNNLNPCCYACNLSKGSLTVEEWRLKINKKYDKLLKDNSSFRLLDRFDMIEKKGDCEFYFENYHG